MGKYNLKTALFLAGQKLKNRGDKYALYIKKEDNNDIDLPPLENTPLISVVIYADEDVTQCLYSVKNQAEYNNIEIIVISDRDIQCEASALVVEYGCDKDTAFKMGLELAKGDYIAFCDSSTILSPIAIYYMVRQLIYDDYDIIYCDEDIIENNERKNPFFKPCWSPHTLRSFNYIGFALIRKSLIVNFSSYNNLLVDLSYKHIKVTNVERILVHKMSVEREEREYIYRKLNNKISIIIPSKDNYEILKRCIDSIRNKSTYNNYEIIITDNGSEESTRKKVSALCDKYIYNKMDFNFSKMCNIGAEKAEGDFLLFLNDDTEVITLNWLEAMLSCAAEEQSGAVGCRLMYPENNKIQHMGVISIKNGPVHGFSAFENKGDLYFGRNKYAYNYSAVTAACMMIDKNKFEGFDEELAIAYNDVDLCWSLIEKGYYNVCLNSVSLYHYESVSRGNDRLDYNKLKRLYGEREILYKKHKNFAFHDCFYNRNLTGHRCDFSVENPQYINRGKFARAIVNPEKYCSGKINYAIEYNYGKDMVSVGGYAYVEGKSTLPYIVVMTRSDVAVPIKANIEIREDISFKMGKNADLCGFSANIDTTLFEKGIYQLGIMLTEKITGRKHIVFTGENIEVK